jgi:hypothetical protein
MSDTDQPGTAAEEQGIVDQQAAALEAIEEAESPDEGELSAEPGGKVDPMEGEAPTG